MASFTTNTPPPFHKDVDDYVKWKQKIKLWQNITDLDKKKRGSYIILRLDDLTQGKVLEQVSEANIAAEEGAKNVIDSLDRMFDDDESVTN